MGSNIRQTDVKSASMILTALPHNEREQLQALRDLLVLDTLFEECFDRLSVFTAKDSYVPIPRMSLMVHDDRSRNSSIGMNVCLYFLDTSFYVHAHAMSKRRVVLDALKDPRLSGSSLNIGVPYLGFYVGTLLRRLYGKIVVAPFILGRRLRLFAYLNLAMRGVLTDLVEEIFRCEEVPT